MTVAVSAAVARGRGGRGLRVHRQHGRQRRRLRRARRPARRGDRARGQDRHRQAGPGADARRARGRAARQLRRGARAGARAGRRATRSRSSTRSTTTASRARRPARSRSATQLGEAPDVLCIPVGNAGNVTAWWKGFQEYGRAPAAARLPGRGRGAAGARRARWRRPETVASRDPDRQPGPVGGRDERLHLLARPGARRVRRRRSWPPTRCSARARGCSASRPRPRRWPGCSSYGAEGTVVCVLTGHGLKDPQTAMNRAASVVPVRARHRERRARRCCA